MAAADIIYVTSDATVEREAGRAAGGLMSCKHNATEVSLTLSTQCAESSGKSKQLQSCHIGCPWTREGQAQRPSPRTSFKRPRVEECELSREEWRSICVLGGLSCLERLATDHACGNVVVSVV